MKKILGAILVLIICFFTSMAVKSWASGNAVIRGDMVSAQSWVPITNNAATQPLSRGVYVGTSYNLDFSYDGSTWQEFANVQAGTVLPIQAVGVRVDSTNAAASNGSIEFLY